MFPIDKVQIPEDSGFSREIAMELANLISVAYNEYEVWDANPNLRDKLPDTITGSQLFADLKTNNLECERQVRGQKSVNTNYERLTQFWQSPKTYKRMENFFFPQWWWFELLKPDNLKNLLRTDIREFWEKIKDIVTDNQILGFIASQENPSRIFVVFRGTREGAEWFNNVRPKPKQFLPEFSDLGEVRNGFNLIYTAVRPQNSLQEFLNRIGRLGFRLFNNQLLTNLRSKISQFFSGDDIIPSKTVISEFFDRYFIENQPPSETEIFITGHSLGAGLATLAALHIAKIAEKHNVNPSIQLYTFASPRVGNEDFAKHFDDLTKIKSFRIINSEDLIQSVPLPTTEIIDDETKEGMSGGEKYRLGIIKKALDQLTDGQALKHYQHVGIPITFTKQTKTIGGNHNLTKTYREALM